MTAKKKPELPSTDLIETHAQEHTAVASAALAQVTSFQIKDNSSYEYAVESIAEFKSKAGEIEALRRSWVEPLNTVVKSINEAFKPPLTSLAAAEEILKRKIVEFVNAQAEERDTLIHQAGEAFGTKRSEKLLERAEEKVVPRIEGVTSRVNWTGEVEDASKIPRKYLIVDEVALRAATRAKGGDPKIPGWRAFPTASVAVNAEAVLNRGKEGQK